MATYYVKTSGDNNNSGSFNSPFATIQRAADVVLPGDAVIVCDGNYPARNIVKRSGDINNPITFQACGDVSCGGFRIQSNYIATRQFGIESLIDTWADGPGIFVQGIGNIVEENYIHNCTRAAIVMHHNQNQSDLMTDCIVRNNRMYHNAMAGLSVVGKRHLIENNEIWETIQHHPNRLTPLSGADADGMRLFGEGHTIRENYIHDIRYDAPENIDPHIDGIQSWNESNYGVLRDSLIENNVVRVLGPLGANNLPATGFMFAGGITNVEIRKNIIESGHIMNSQFSTYIRVHDNIFITVFPNIYGRQPYGIDMAGSQEGWEVGGNIYLDSDLLGANWTQDSLKQAISNLMVGIGKTV